MGSSAYVRSLLREGAILPPETGTVVLESGIVYSSVLYALAFVKKYAYDPDAIRLFFGKHVGYEDLQAEMLYTLVVAAASFAKVKSDGTPQAFRRYLSRCLKSRLYDLDKKVPRERFNRRTGEWQEMPPVYEESLEVFLDTVEAEGEECPKSLTIEDVSDEVDDILTCKMFLASLTERQRAIALLRYEHVANTCDGVLNKDIARELKISERTLNRELLKIQAAYVEYAVTSNTGWLAFLRGLGK